MSSRFGIEVQIGIVMEWIQGTWYVVLSLLLVLESIVESCECTHHYAWHMHGWSVLGVSWGGIRDELQQVGAGLDFRAYK